LQRRAISTEFCQRLGQVGEQLGHLGAGLEVLLRAEALRPALVAQHIALRDADARLVRLVVVAAQELHRMRRHQRQAEARREVGAGGHQHLVCRGTIAPAGTLDFDVIGAGEQACPGLGTHLGLVQLAGRQQLRDVPRRAAGKRDQAAVVALP
jgi:hypothetical protein